MPISGSNKKRSGGDTKNMKIRYEEQRQAKKSNSVFGVRSSSTPPFDKYGMRVNPYDKKEVEQEQAPDPFAINSFDPPGGEILTTQTFTFIFNNDIDISSVRFANNLTPGSDGTGGDAVTQNISVIEGVLLTPTLEVNITNNVMTITPDAPFGKPENISINFDDFSSGIKDIYGSELSNQSYWYFTLAGGVFIG